MLCVPFKRMFEEDNDNQIVNTKKSLNVIRIMPLLRQMKFDTSLLKRKCKVENLCSEENETINNNGMLGETQIVPMEVVPLMNSKPKIIKELKHVGFKSNPLLDKMFWKPSPTTLIVYQDPNDCINHLMNNSNDKEPCQLMELC